ncbi:MAG: carbohydrate binding domain-containing protein [Pseudomonadota bacterium]
MRSLRPVLTAALIALAGTAAIGDDIESAHFTVTDRVINADVKAFTATIEAIGNGHRFVRGGSFEPTIFRNQFVATGGSDRIITTTWDQLTGNDNWRTGALDGAEVEVLRIEDGAFRRVRMGTIANNGFQANGWVEETRGRHVAADSPSYTFTWDRWSQPHEAYYFTVRTLDADGRRSVAPPAVSVVHPGEAERRGGGGNLQRLRSVDRPSDRVRAPDNLRANLTPEGRVELTWDPVPGAAGYAVFRSDTNPANHTGFQVLLTEGGPAVQSGDLVILRKKFYRADRTELPSKRMWGARQIRNGFGTRMIRHMSDDPAGADWHLVPHAPDTPVENPGETFLRVTPRSGEVLPIGIFNYAGTAQDWYEVLEPGREYTFEAWIRSDGGQPVEFRVEGHYQGAIPPARFATDGTWTRYVHTFTPHALFEGDAPGQMVLNVTGPGAYDIDNMRIYRSDTPFLALLPEEQDQLRASGMAALRTHAFIKTRTNTYDLEQLTNTGGVTRIDWNNSLPQNLSAIDSVDMDPWLQVEPHFSAEEWQGLVEYLAAPFDPAVHSVEDRPWAAKRHAQGQSAPWIDAFDTLYFEVGNETWNGLFRPWVFGGMRDAGTGREISRGTAYGLYQEYVLAAMRQSPYWDALADKIVPVLGGHARSDFGFEAARVSPNSPVVGHAGYIGGWDEGEGPVRPTPLGFTSVLMQVAQGASRGTQEHADKTAAAARARGVALSFGTYEAGPGYALDGLNRNRVTPEQAALQEEAMKSAAAGAATLDGFLDRAANGMSLQNFFTYGIGPRWTSHTAWHHGGHPHPSWDALSMFNTHALGDMLAVETRKNVPVDIPAVEERPAVNDAPGIGVYATRQGDRLSVIVISRRVPDFPDAGDDGRTTVTVDLPISSAASLTRIAQTGTHASNNLSGPQTRFEPQSLPVPDSLPQLTIEALEPGKAALFVFEGVG